MSDNFKDPLNDSTVATDRIPAKEILRNQRKKNYAAYKNARKQDKLNQIKQKEHDRAQKRQEKDKNLMAMLVKATELDNTSK